MDFGAKGDGTTLDTASISATISAAAKAGGGIVIFPAGRYITGTFRLASNITLDLQPGSVLEGSKNVADYGSIAEYGLAHLYGTNSSGEGDKMGIIFGRNVENVALVGQGVIAGNGDSFFDLKKAHGSMDFDPAATRQVQRSVEAINMVGDGPVALKPEGRPGTMIVCFDCKNVLIRDVTLRNAPNWTAHFQRVERATVSNFHVVNDPLLPNNDGFDCFSCKDVHYSDCDIRTGDDDFAIVDSVDVTVANCTLASRSSGIRLEASQYNMFENLTIHANRGLAIYERGFGKTDHISFANIRIETALLTGDWWGKGEPIYIAVGKPQAGPGSGEISNVTFSNVSGDAESSIVLYGHPDAWLRNILLDNVHFSVRTTRKDVSELVGGNFDFRWVAPHGQGVFKHDIPGIYARYVDGLHIQNSSIRWCASELCNSAEELLTAKNAKDAKIRGKDHEPKPTGPDFFSSAIELEDFRNLDLNGFAGSEASGTKSAAISLHNGKGVSIRDSTAAAGTRIFLEARHISGKRLLMNNDLSNAATVLKGEASGFVLRGNYLSEKTPKAAAAH